jgi:hypothetical protein
MRKLQLVLTAKINGKEVESIPFEDEDEYNTEDTYNSLIKKYCRTKNAEVRRDSIYLYDMWLSCIDKITSDQLAESFANTIKEWLDPEEMEKVIARNEINIRENNGCCATHDFCDANMAMVEALSKHSLIWEMADEVQQQLINEAWNKAKQNKFWYEASGKSN